MDRLPFDPDKVPPRKPVKPARRERARDGKADAPKPLTVTQVVDLVKGVLAAHTPTPMRVVGEVGSFSESRHWFLSLKDEQSVLSCVMWASAASRCGFVPERGQQMVATGRLDFFGPQGRLQLYVDKLEPAGAGELERRFRELCDELRRLGYFDEARKKPLPTFPERIAVVTSGGAAALQDVIRTAQQRWSGQRLTLVDVRVQGAEAAGQIAGAIDALSDQADRLGIDAILLTRGGGSLEDLWAFNERAVADAIFRCRVPIVAAIGHETDTTVAELVADLRCSTPTQAAMRLVPDASQERHRLAQHAGRLAGALKRRVERDRARLDGLARHAWFRRPGERLDRLRRDLAAVTDRLTAAIRQRLHAQHERLGRNRTALGRLEPIGRLELGRQRLDALTHRARAALALAVRQHRAALDGRAQRLEKSARDHAARTRRRLDALARELEAIGPRQVLRRGYSYTTTADGTLIRSIAQASVGQEIRTHLADGDLRSAVLGEGESPSSVRKAPARRSRRKRQAPDPGQPNLFSDPSG